MAPVGDAGCDDAIGVLGEGSGVVPAVLVDGGSGAGDGTVDLIAIFGPHGERTHLHE